MFRLAIVFSCALALASLQFSQADDCSSDDGSARNLTVADRTLCMEFRVLRDVIPNTTLISLTTVYHQNSFRFRHALRFIQDDKFMDITAQIEESAAYQQMLQELQNAGVNTTDLGSIISILDCISLPVPISNSVAISPVSNVRLRSLTTYVNELMRAIPRAQFNKVLIENLQGNEQFRLFYRVVRNPNFQRAMLVALRSRDVAPALSVLRRNYIDLDKLIAIVYRILSWGPRI